MAEKLLEAIAKGSYKAVADPVKQATKTAVDPNVMATIYKTGIIGPLIRSVVAEYKKGEPASKSKMETSVISDLSKNLNSLSVQLSSIADIMDDIRTLNSQQLKVDKDQFVKERREIKKNELKSIEEKLEAKKPSVSSIASVDKKGGIGFIKDIGNFIKNNPLLTAAIVGTITVFSDELQKFFRGVLKGSQFQENATEAATKLRDTIGVGVSGIFDRLGIEISDSLNKIFSSAVIGGIVAHLLRMRFRTGALAGAGVAIGQQGNEGQGKESDWIDNFINGVLGIAAGSAAIGIGKFALKSGGNALKDKITKPRIEPQIKPPVSSIPPTPTQPKSGIIVPGQNEVGREGREARARKEKQISKQQLSTTAKRLNKIIQRRGIKWVMKFLAARLGFAATAAIVGGAATSWSGVGLVIFLLGVGYAAYEIYDVISEMESYDSDTFSNETGSTDNNLGRILNQGAEQMTPEQRMSLRDSNPMIRPPLSAFDADDYTQKVIAAESGGQNKKNPLSSAYGVYQITKETFEGIRNNNKELQKFSYEQFQQNTDIQKKFFEALTEENAKKLEKAGFEPDQKNLYLAHRFGITDALSILRKSKEPGGMNEPLSSVIPAERFKKIDEQNTDISAGTTIAGAMLGAYAKMDSNVQMNSSLASMTPATNPLENLSFIKELQAIESALTGKPTTIIMDNSQNMSSTGSSNESRPGNPSTVMPYIREHDKIHGNFFNNLN